MHNRLVRALAIYLALALIPTRFVISWLLTGPSSASAAVEEENEPKGRTSLTDLAPPQDRFVVPASEGPAARLERLGLVPRDLSPEEQRERFGPHFANATEAREFQLARLTTQIGNRAQAEAVIAEFENRREGTPSLHLPTLEPRVPDPFVPLPARADYKRADQVPDIR
jgi:hypothetical protein